MKKHERQALLRRIGQTVSQLRRSKGLGQDRLTDKAGLARGTVSKIERGTVDPRATTLARLARALDVQLAKILELAG